MGKCGTCLHLSSFNCQVLGFSTYLKDFFHEFCFRVNFLLFSVIPKEVYAWPDTQSCRLPHDDTKDI